MPDGSMRCAVTVAAALLAVPSAFGQEAINTDAALQPSEGALIIRQLFRYREATTDPTPMDRDVRELNFTTTFIYGISAELAAIFKVPLVYREVDFPSPAGTDREWGVRDLEALLKIRLYRDDFGPARTARFDLLAGMEFYSGDADFATRSVDPEIGGVFTYLRDRHAIDADLIWRLDTSGDVADRMRYDLAYVHRLYPAVYEAGKFDSVFGSCHPASSTRRSG
jgi:hypothetical protein